MPRAPGRLCLFDLDRTLLEGRSVLQLAERFGVLSEVQAIWDRHREQELAAGPEESRAIAALFRGTPYEEFQRASRNLPLRDGAWEAIRDLRRLGFRVGVISAGYTTVTSDVRERLQLDTSAGVDLLVRDGRLTGEIAPSRHSGPCRQHVCKASVLRSERSRWGAGFVAAVGDGRNDVCMIEAADFGVAIEPCHPRLRSAADAVIQHLRELAPRVAEQLGLPAA